MTLTDNVLEGIGRALNFPLPRRDVGKGRVQKNGRVTPPSPSPLPSMEREQFSLSYRGGDGWAIAVTGWCSKEKGKILRGLYPELRRAQDDGMGGRAIALA